jgi:membrane protease YdiL (CAAX protease family)
MGPRSFSGQAAPCEVWRCVASNSLLRRRTVTRQSDQYTLWQIVGIWLAAGLPMWVLGWMVYPTLSAGLTTVDAGLLRIKLLTLGLIWQFVLSMTILYREEGSISIRTLSRRFWLNQPVSARTGQADRRLWWWLIPFAMLVVALEVGLRSSLTGVWARIFPFFAEPEGYDFSALLAPDLRAQWVGAWGLLGLFFVLALFNTFLGEEFVFRGVLLPKMQGVFGRWDWVANGVLFAFYHLHQPWGILADVAAGLVFAFSGKRFRSNWFPIILHSGQSVFFLFLILGLVLGVA